MLYLSLQSRIFKILSGFPGLSFKKKRKEEENLIKATIKAKDSKAFSSDIATLFMAAQKGLPDVLRALLLSTKADVNVTISMKGKTYTLLSIIPERHKVTISLLKKYGAK